MGADAASAAAAGTGGYIAGHGVNALCPGRIFAKRSGRFSSVASDANLRIDFNLTEKRDIEYLGHMLAFAVAEHVDVALAVRAGEVAHVFDHAENFDVHLAEHLDGLAHVRERDHRRRGDDNRAADRHALDQAELHVACAGRQIRD